MYDLVPGHILRAFVGLLASPSRGWFIFSPVAAFGVLGLWRTRRFHDKPSRLLALLGCSCAVLLLSYTVYGGWIGGHCYGPRFLTDLAAVTALATVYVVPASWSALLRADLKVKTFSLIFATALFASSLVQIIGSYSGAAGPIWNAVPVDVGVAPERIWRLHDSQIERNSRALFYRYAPVFPTAGSGYSAGFGATITGIEGIDGCRRDQKPQLVCRAASTSLIAVRLNNSGTVPLYGYTTAVYNGEVQVRANVATVAGVVTSEQTLYVADVTQPGLETYARGLMTFPNAPGLYHITLDPIAVGRDDIPAGNRRAYSALFRVE